VTWTWVCLKNDGFFAGDQVWDQELITSRGMQLYEILYDFEIYSLLFSLLSIAGDPVSIEDVSLTTLSVTLSLLYFFAYSRSRSHVFAENVFGIMLFRPHIQCMSRRLLPCTPRCTGTRPRDYLHLERVSSPGSLCICCMQKHPQS
jgi:hypothetical protein